jgi:hypothetical protein
MSRALPPEADRVLDYVAYVETLSSVVGERVHLEIEGLGAATRVAATGPLRRLSGEETAFSIGDAVLMLLDRTDFRAARLRTFDGNAHFVISARFGETRFLVGDPDLLATDWDEVLLAS